MAYAELALDRGGVEAADLATAPRFEPRVSGLGPDRRQDRFPPEFMALRRAGVHPAALRAALAEAERVGACPFDALAARGGAPIEDLVARLARALGVTVAGPEDGASQPIDADTFSAAMANGVLATRTEGGDTRIVVAARGAALARLAAQRRGRLGGPRVALAAPRDFAALAVRLAGPALAARAAQGPAVIHPKLTVAEGLPRVGLLPRLAAGLVLLGLVACGAIVPAAGVALLMAGGALFLALNALRLALAGAAPADGPPARALSDAELPVYTVLTALYREGAVAPALMESLGRLDYPAAKLDIKVLTEQGDQETLDALARCPLGANVEVLTLPPGGPQTKPRALNAGLMAARGELLCVFDAEDRPDPKQLRIAAAAFRAGGPDLACVQARLAIDNFEDGWLARHFAIEYAALFDVVLPALSRFGLPIPLGGTSNHFRTAALRAVGGWDASNVTEDADLGLRLARFGWRTETIPSVTWEEAPARLWPWIRQRTRWMKGYMVTAALHARRAGGLARRLDPLSFAVSQMLVAGVALTALAYPVVFALLLWQGLSGALLAPAESMRDAALAGFHTANLMVGFSAAIACGWLGIDRRCPARLARDLWSLPFYWLLVGAAAWRALGQIALARVTDWEKTAHGVSRRRAPPTYT